MENPTFADSPLTIRFVLVYPRNRHRVRYYVNENVRDAHHLGYEEMYRFLCNHISPPTTVEINEFLRTFQPFFVDVENNRAVKLSFNTEELIQEQIRKHRRIDFDAVYDQAQFEYSPQNDPIMKGSVTGQHTKKTSQEPAPYANQLKNALDRILGDENNR